MRKITTLIISILLLASYSSFACTGICTKDSQKVYFACNEDTYRAENTFNLTIFPGNETEYSVICIINPNDGDWRVAINEKGLCYDSYAAPYEEVTYNSDKPNIDYFTFMNFVLHTCETVDEVLDVYNQYFMPFLSSTQFMFSDSTGKSVVLEGNNIVINENLNYQVCTNFYQSSGVPGYRYKYATSVLDTAQNYSFETVTGILQYCSQNSSQILTQYSLIYDANEQDIYLYHRAQYDKYYKFNFQEAISEVTGNSKSISLENLFIEELTSIYTLENKSKINLEQNYPNPFHNETTVSFSLEKQSQIELIVYNSLGQIVKVMEDNPKPAGIYRYKLQRGDMKPGIYFYKLSADEKSRTRKMIIL